MISFSGKKRSGKDLAAQYLIDNHGYRKVTLAGPVKEFTANVLGLPLKFFVDDELKDTPFNVSIQLYSAEIIQIIEDLVELNSSDVNEVKWGNIPLEKNLKTPREALQFIGTDLGRNFVSKNIWLDQLPSEFMDDCVITDARFANERDFLKKRGYKTVLLMRNSESTDTHESENSLGHPKEYDDVVRNFGSKDKLYVNLEAIVNPTLGNRIRRFFHG